MISKEKAFRVEIKYYDKIEKCTKIQFIFCTAIDPVDVLEYAYNKFSNLQSDLNEYKIIEYEFHKEKDSSMFGISQILSLRAFDYCEIYN